jgi:HK97 family phage portal protein
VPSLIGKALALRNATPPVPMANAYTRGLPYTSLASTSDAYLRAYGAVGTVWQIVHLLASNVAKPEWRLYRKQKRDGRVRYTTSDQGSDQRQEVVQHQALNVLAKPAAMVAQGRELTVYSRFTLFEASQQYMELTGEWFWVVEYDPRASFPVGAWPVMPHRLEPVPDPDTYLKGWAYTPPDGSEPIPLYPHEVIQGKYPNPLDPYRGLGPVQSVLVDIDAARYSAEWNRNFFINSAEPGGVIQVDHTMDDDEWDDLTNRWRETHRGVARAHRVAVLEGGATWVPNQHSLRDMDFANLRGVSRDIIREAFGIHKIMLGNSDDVNRANAQTGEEVFANWSVAPRLDRWREVLNGQFLPLFGTAGAEVEFDYVYPLPSNREQDNAELVSKATAAQLLISLGVFDPHDVLEVVGLPDMDTVAAPTPGGPAPGPEGAPAGAADRLPWQPFMLGDRRFSQVNGKSLVRTR